MKLQTLVKVIHAKTMKCALSTAGNVDIQTLAHTLCAEKVDIVLKQEIHDGLC